MVSLQKILLASLSFACATVGFGQSVASVRFDPPSFTAGQATTGTVYLSQPAPAGGLTVTLKSSRGGFTLPTAIAVPVGVTSANFYLTSTPTAAGTTIVTAFGGGTSRKAAASVAGPPFISYERVSLTSADAQGNNHSGEPYKGNDGDARKISADGRYVVFTSQATNLVGNDKNRKYDVFLRDRQLGLTTRVSQPTTGGESNGNSYQPCISADGNFVAFVSEATNMFSPDANGQPDVLLWSRLTGAITLVSRNGNVAANDASLQPSINANGRFVAYQTFADNLAANDKNGLADVYVFDASKGTSKRVSMGYNPWAVQEPNGDSGSPSINASGRFVAYESFADNLVPNDVNMCEDVFVRDVNAGVTTRASIAPNGLELDGFSFCPSISADGKIVAFSTYAPILEDGSGYDEVAKILVREMSSPASVVAVDLFYADAVEPSISADGRAVAFLTYSLNTGMFGVAGIFDRVYGSTQFLTTEHTGDVSLSNDGRYAILTSSARSLVTDDTNGKDDIFVADVRGQQIVSITGPGVGGNGGPIVGGDAVTLKLNLMQPAKEPLTIRLITLGAGISVPETVTVPGGATNVSFKAATSPAGVNQFPSIAAVCNSRAVSTNMALVNGLLTVTPGQIKVGGTATVKIRLASAPVSTLTMAIHTVSDGVTAPQFVRIPAGVKSKLFTITVGADMTPGSYFIQAIGGDYYLSSQFEVVK